jgi:hypothetical protein
MMDITPLQRKETGFAGAVRRKIAGWLNRCPWLLHLIGTRTIVSFPEC